MNPLHPIGLAVAIAAFVAGAIGWTFAEYTLHRFVMHELRGKGIASREHLTHHARKNYYLTWGQKIGSAAVGVAVVAPLAVLTLGVTYGAIFALGFTTMYLTYEFLHRRAHTHPPRTAYGRWLRRAHFIHHFGSPMRNHGVTSPFWDIVFGTSVRPEAALRVPSRLALDWLVDDDGNVRPEFAADYVIVGTRNGNAEQSARDLADAYANLAPAD